MAKKDKLIKTTAMVTVVIVLSKMCGLLRDVITAGYFGTGIDNDAYASAYSLFYIPVLLFNSCITATVVPLFVEEREKHSLRQSNHFASNALNLFMVAALTISALMFVFAEPLVRLIYRFDEGGILLTVKLTRIMLLGLVFNVASIVIASLLNAMERFMAAQLTGFPLSVAVIVSTVLFSKTMGVEAIAWGVFAASVLQVAVLIPSLLGWFRYTPVIDIKDKRFHRLMKMALPAILSMGVSEINHQIDRSLASTLAAGSISAMNYAYKLITFLLGVLMVPLTTVMFSRMSRLAAKDDKGGVIDALKNSVSIILLATLPILAVAMVLSCDVVKMIYMRGSFDMNSVNLTGAVLLFYLVGVPAFGLRDLMNRSFHAIQDTKTPFRVACLVVALNIGLNFALRGPMGAQGLALATSLSSYIGLFVMLALFRKRMGRIGFKSMLPELIKLCIAAALTAAACYGMHLLLPETMTTLATFGRLVAAAVVSFIVYFVACLILRVKVMNDILGSLLRRVRK